MSTEEVGAYVLLLCFQWNAGSVPPDDDAIRRIARVTQAFPLGSLKAKFEIGADGLLRNERLELERSKQIAYREACSDAGKAGADKRWGRHSQAIKTPMAKGMAKHSSPSPSPSPSPLSDPDLRSPKRETGNGASLSLSEVFDEWNKRADNTTVPKCLLLSDKRRRILGARLAEPFFVTNWLTALDKIHSSAFCKGQSERGWRASFDWFIQPDSVPKIIEGKYDNHIATKSPQTHQFLRDLQKEIERDK